MRVVCIEDNADDYELATIALERSQPGRFETCRVEEMEGFVQALARGCDVILCDFNLPRFSPYAVLQALHARGETIPMVVVTRAIGEDAAVHVLRSGAKDYVTKDKLGTLAQVIERVLTERRRIQEQARMAAELEAALRRLKSVSSWQMAAQERERNLISRELHDQLAQTLAGMMLHLHAARRTSDQGAAGTHQTTALTMAQGAIEQLKALSFSLRPAQLDLLGLVAAAQSAVQRIAEPAGLAYMVTARGKEPAVLGETASVALRLVQEAL
ncbi:MAG TPA: histidine kinase, partial [Ramlibacter sp.]|nr:histidine kinase [Ramlibacter sp.]